MNADLKIKLKENLGKELKILILISFLIVVILKIAFYKESVVNVVKFCSSLIYFSLLPGFFILMNFDQWLTREIRLVLAFPVGFAVYAISGYYLNIFIKLDYILFLPLIIIFISVMVYYWNNKNVKMKLEIKES